MASVKVRAAALGVCLAAAFAACGPLIGVGSLSGGSAADASADDGSIDEPSRRCAQAGLLWSHWSGTELPDEAFAVGEEPGSASGADAGVATLYVCRAHDPAGNAIPGKFVDGVGCLYTDGTTELHATNFDVLVDPLGCLDIAEYDGMLPSGALAAGSVAGAPVYVCTAALHVGAESSVEVGFLRNRPNAGCTVSYGGKGYAVSSDVSLLIID